VLESLFRECGALAGRIAKKREVGIEIRPMSVTTPAPCAPRVQSAVEKASEALGLPWQRLYSAAGHDAQNLTAITDSGMVFIPSLGGRSHRVDEMSSWEAIERGGNVLVGALVTLAG
jgi:N-carbamoyl-L-amino-acid hydrolase